MTNHSREAEVLTMGLLGLEPRLIQIRVALGGGPTSFTIVGLPEAQTRETRVRVRAALQQIGVDLSHDITVLITPEEAPKSGAHDVAIALAVLGAIGRVSPERLQKTLILGELSLTGAVRPVRGVLPSLRGAVAKGFTRAIVPKDNAAEASNAPGIRAHVVGNIQDLVRHLGEGIALEGVGGPAPFPPEVARVVADMSDIRGLGGARRALEIAAAGGHHLLFIGPPGAGRTMLARRLPEILPPLTLEEALEVTAVQSVAGLLSLERGFVDARPFRAPHHTVSAAGLVGGGSPVRPGEVSLAHQGVLFLDELPEFKLAVVEALQQPLEEGRASIYQKKTRTTFPARPLIVGGTNPCPCGYAGERSARCTCSPERVKSYWAHMRGPLFERFDMRIVLPPADVAEIQRTPRGESSAEVQKRVVAARALRAARKQNGLNSQLVSRELERFASPDAAGQKVLAQALEKLKLSAADNARVLRVARTIADLDGSDAVRSPHFAEALHAIGPSNAPSSTTPA